MKPASEEEPVDDTNSGVKQTNLDQFENLIAEAEPKFDPLEQAERILDNAAFYDFSFYEFLFHTETGYQGFLSEQALATLDDFQAMEDVGAELAIPMLEVLVQVEQVVRYQIRRLKRRDWSDEEVVHDLLEDFYRLRASTLPGVLAAYQAESETGIGELFMEFLAELIGRYLRSRLYQTYPSFYGFWIAWAVFFNREFSLWDESVNPPPEPEQTPTAPTRRPPGQTGTITDDKAHAESERAQEDNPRVVQK
jgi:hypothetical protein